MATIATRMLSSTLGAVRVELEAPYRVEREYACVYRIEGPRIRKRVKVLGVDGFQALQLAIERIGADLRASAEFEAGPLRWLDMDEPGFPLPASINHLGWAVRQP